MAVYFTLCFALLALLWFLLIHFGIRIFSHFLNSYSYKEWLKNTINLLWSGLCLAILLWFSLDFPVPVPNWFPKEGNVASSMRATAEDLAHFLIELAAPQHLDMDLIDRMRTPQVTVDEHISWGLGIGIQHSVHGESLWHWGSNPGSKSVMVIYPAQCNGVVVLANSWNGSNFVFEIAGRALGGKTYWKISSPQSE